MGNRIVICHYDNGGHWNAIEISTSALNGHENHDMDIWPPVEDVTDGMNWPEGETVYLNDCVLAASPEPTATSTATASVTATPSPTETLPDTGANLNMSLVGMALIAVGAWMKYRSIRR